MICKEDVYNYIKENVKPTKVAIKYLGEPKDISSDNYKYYSPLRKKERTPSFFVSDEKGIHDFGTDVHYSVISFVKALYGLSYWDATEKIIEDFDIDLTQIKKEENKESNSILIKKFEIEFEQGKKPYVIKTYFDERCFKCKPKDLMEIAGIKKRVGEKQNMFYKYKSIDELADEILKGKTCIPSAIKGNAKQKWKMQQVFLVDFDNTIKGEKIMVNDKRHCTVEEVLSFCKEKNILPTLVYYTFSNTYEQNKFRFVYVMESPIEKYEIAEKVPIFLLGQLKKFNPDVSKKNLADMFFGGKEIAYIGNNYYKVKERWK